VRTRNQVQQFKTEDYVAMIGLLGLAVCLVIFAPLFRFSKPEVVKLVCEDESGQTWQGAGVFVDDDLILTAGHMVEGAKTIKVFYKDGTIRLAYKWYMEDKSVADLGIVVVRTPEREPIAYFMDLEVGDDVIVVGNPLGFFPVVTKGIISAVDMYDDFWGSSPFVFTDAATNAGNSGGPAFTTHYEIAGIVVGEYRFAEGLNVVVPASVCEKFIEKYWNGELEEL